MSERRRREQARWSASRWEPCASIRRSRNYRECAARGLRGTYARYAILCRSGVEARANL